MVILSAIGRFFKKIWDWIKQTAWIQPLLIVGVIFGVIFSIPSIVGAIKDAGIKKNSAEVYYLNYQVSLEGGENSDADKLINKIMNPNGSTDKFFLVFVEEGNGQCTNMKGGFQVLEDKFGSGTFEAIDDRGFKMVTIFKDQITSSTTDDKSAFEQFMERNDIFFNEKCGDVYDAPYWDGKESGQLDNLTNGEAVPTPTIMLVDLAPTSTEERHFESGVTEIIFNLEGGTDFEKAKTLMHCWNHTDEFEITK